MKRMLLIASITLLAALSALAADVAGNWKATAQGPNGPMERTFAFHVDGEKLSGETVSSFLGKSEIQEGSVKGDDIAFKITADFQGNEMEITYKGKVVSDNEIKLVSEAGDNQFQWDAKRQ